MEKDVEDELKEPPPDPLPPVSTDADHRSITLEFVEYPGCEVYILEMAFKENQNQNMKPRKKTERARQKISDNHSPFTCELCNFFSDDHLLLHGKTTGHLFEGTGSLNWMTMYSGVDRVFKVENLLPGMGYVFRLQVLLSTSVNSVSSVNSKPMLFFTVPCSPYPPEAPVLVDRGRTSLKMKWCPPIVTGGMSISEYSLEMKSTAGSEYQGFTRIYAGTALSHKVTRLLPGTEYIFRIQASNCLGESKYSEDSVHATAASVPAAPPPPKLVNSSPTSIVVIWQEPESHGSPVTCYTLEVDDGQEGPFSVVYVGENRRYELGDLKSGKKYRFRVFAQNDVGKGALSLPAEMNTMYSSPSSPNSPIVSARASTNALISWKAPDNDGGTSIIGYELQIKACEKQSGTSSWLLSYDGNLLTHTVHHLRPGHRYSVRIRAKNVVGIGGFSPETSFLTAAGPPDAPSAPTFDNVQTNNVNVKWREPLHDGGTSIIAYRLEMYDSTSNDYVSVYRGLETLTTVKELLPGRNYGFKVQAINSVGCSAWSNMAEISTQAAEPSCPEPPVVTQTLATSVSLRWKASYANGSAICAYKLHMANMGYGISENSSDDSLAFQSVYEGPSTGHTVKNLHPYTRYSFRVQALNSVGMSILSDATVLMMPAAAPAEPSPPVVVASSPSSLLLQWKFPERDNGARVTSFNVEMKALPELVKGGDEKGSSKRSNSKKKIAGVNSDEQWVNVYSGLLLEYEVCGLLPGRLYCFRVNAGNEYGESAYSQQLTSSTKPTKPSTPTPPSLSPFSPTSLRIRWTSPSHNGAPITRYKLLLGKKSRQLRKVYEGPWTSYKATKLDSGGQYEAAVQAINSMGASEESQVSSVMLPAKEISVAEAPKVEYRRKRVFISWCTVEEHLKDDDDDDDTLFFTLEMEGNIIIYQGAATRFEYEGKMGKRYRVRVRANGSDGPWSPWSSATSTSTSSSSASWCMRNVRMMWVMMMGTMMGMVMGMKKKIIDEIWSLKMRRVMCIGGIAFTILISHYINNINNIDINNNSVNCNASAAFAAAAAAATAD